MHTDWGQEHMSITERTRTREFASVGDLDLCLFSIRLTSARLESERDTTFGQRVTRVSLVLTAEVNNRETGMPIEIRHCVPIPIGPSSPHECDSFIRSPGFHSWVQHELSRLMNHEIDENLYRDGRLVKDPHAPRAVLPAGEPRQYPSPKATP